jgi:hypothetical protein
MGETKNVEKKREDLARLGSGPGQGCAQQHRRDILLQKEKEPAIRGEISRRPHFQNQSLGSLAPRKAKLEPE